MYLTMPCPVCDRNIGEADHRMCLLELFREKKINSSKDWEKMCKAKPKTIVKGIVYKTSENGSNVRYRNETYSR